MMLEKSLITAAWAEVEILAAGDAIGAVMLLSKEPGAVISPTDVKVAETAANFMGKQLEN